MERERLQVEFETVQRDMFDQTPDPSLMTADEFQRRIVSQQELLRNMLACIERSRNHGIASPSLVSASAELQDRIGETRLLWSQNESIIIQIRLYIHEYTHA